MVSGKLGTVVVIGDAVLLLLLLLVIVMGVVVGALIEVGIPVAWAMTRPRGAPSEIEGRVAVTDVGFRIVVAPLTTLLLLLLLLLVMIGCTCCCLWRPRFGFVAAEAVVVGVATVVVGGDCGCVRTETPGEGWPAWMS